MFARFEEDWTLRIGKRKVWVRDYGSLKTVERIFKIIKEKNVEVDLEEVDPEGRPLHSTILVDRVLRRENADQKAYKRIFKSCYNSL